jgi:hypothetical protein
MSLCLLWRRQHSQESTVSFASWCMKKGQESTVDFAPTVLCLVDDVAGPYNDVFLDMLENFCNHLCS